MFYLSHFGCQRIEKMQNDTIIWNSINKHFCSFKTENTDDGKQFCRHPYSNTSLCNRGSCPLANSSYGTVIEQDGLVYLMLKTVERAHTPKRLWEKVKLPVDFQAAIAAIEASMVNVYSEVMINRCKMRFTRIRQTLIQARKLQLTPRMKLVRVHKKSERREESREKKAEVAAEITNAISKELVQRLYTGVYGELYDDFASKAREAEEDGATQVPSEVDENDFEFVEAEDDDDALIEEATAMMKEEQRERRKVAREMVYDESTKRKKPRIEIEYEYDVGSHLKKEVN